MRNRVMVFVAAGSWVAFSPALAGMSLSHSFDNQSSSPKIWIAQHDADPAQEMVGGQFANGPWTVTDLASGTKEGVILASTDLVGPSEVIPDSDGDGLDEVVTFRNPATLMIVEGLSVLFEAPSDDWDWAQGLSNRNITQTDADASVEILLRDRNTHTLYVIDSGTGTIEFSYDFVSQFYVTQIGDVDGDNLNEIVIEDFGNQWYVFDTTGPATSVEDDLGVWQPGLQLGPSSPEPTSDSVTIDFALSSPGAVTIRVLDVGGRLVKSVADDLHLPSGVHTVTWDGRDRNAHDAPSGIYFVQLATGTVAESRRLTVVR